MRDIDGTDREILDLLLADGRRSWRDVADAVDLSPPAVADRVDRLEELGVIRGFTVDVDRSKLDGGTPVLVTLAVEPGAAGSVADGLADAESVDHVFTTADSRVVFSAAVPDEDVPGLLESAVAVEDVRDVDVSLVTGRRWNPGVGEVTLALTCVECGNRVTSEGESRVIDGERYHFCCESCEARFVETYEELSDGADA